MIQFPNLKTSKELECLNVGHIGVNALELIVPFKSPNPIHKTVDAFILHDISMHGKICLVYVPSSHEKMSNAAKSEIQFYSYQTESWYFISETFTEYFRMQILHLGVQGWQLSYTDIGVPQSTLDWLYFYAPHEYSFANHDSKKCLKSQSNTKISMEKVHKMISVIQKEVLTSNPTKKPSFK
jgi:hypothetical protein